MNNFVGTKIYGYCEGYFGRDDYSDVSKVGLEKLSGDSMKIWIDDVRKPPNEEDVW